MIKKIPLAKQWYQHKEKPFTQEALLNVYAEPGSAASPGVGEFVLRRRPGAADFAYLGSGECRGFVTKSLTKTLFACAGDRVFKINSAGTVTMLWGSLFTLTGPVTFAENSAGQMALCDGRYLYMFSDTLVLHVSDSDLPYVGTIDCHDGFGVFPILGTNKFGITSNNDFMAYDALDYAAAEKQQDILLRVVSAGEYLYMFGEKTIELWYNAGGADFPFARASGGTVDCGLAAIHSVAKMDGMLFFLAADGTVRRTSGGGQPQIISTRPIDDAIRTSEQKSDAEGFGFMWGGHAFYVLTVPDVGTFCYDVSSDVWTEWATDGHDRCLFRFYTYNYNKHLVGDYTSGAIYELSSDVYTDSGTMVPVEIILPPIHADGNPFFVASLTVDFKGGQGLVGGAAPQVMLSYSRDGGFTWSSEAWRSLSLGAVGEYDRRVKWTRLGRFRESAMFKLRITDPVSVAVFGAQANIQVGEAQ